MNITYNPYYTKFEVKSEYTKKPLVFSVRRRGAVSPHETVLLNREVRRLERWAHDQEGTMTNKFRVVYASLMRDAFTRILGGARRTRIIEERIWKTARRLNAKGENDYVIDRIERDAVEAWEEDHEEA